MHHEPPKDKSNSRRGVVLAFYFSSVQFHPTHHLPRLPIELELSYRQFHQAHSNKKMSNMNEAGLSLSMRQSAPGRRGHPAVARLIVT